MKRAALLLAVLAGCASTPPPPEDPPANREDVIAALYEQFERVLARHRALQDETGPEAQRERDELAQLADEIAMKIVRIDPSADVQGLIARLENTR